MFDYSKRFRPKNVVTVTNVDAEVALSLINETSRRLVLAMLRQTYGPHSIFNCPYKSHINCVQKERK